PAAPRSLVMHRHLASSVSLVLIGVLTVGSVGVAAPDEQLKQAGSTPMPLTIDGETIALWGGNALVIVQNRFSQAPLVRVLDRNGTQTSQFTFNIPGARLINIYDNSV